MNDISKQIEGLWKSDRCQVFLFTCLTNFPHNFAVHPWFVVNKKSPLPSGGRGNDNAARYEVRHYSRENSAAPQYVHKNEFPLFRGIPISYVPGEHFWPAKLRSVIEGDDGSPAQRMIECIERSPQEYPHRTTYSTLGPNSNTYAQWVLNHVPESGMTLPWNAFGKRFGK